MIPKSVNLFCDMTDTIIDHKSVIIYCKSVITHYTLKIKKMGYHWVIIG